MNDETLQAWVERVSLESFGIPFKHRATFNGRLKATGGRYFTKSHNIEISPHQLEAFGAEETEKIIKHELCHYHLHIMKRGYQHRDQDFKQLLVQVGASRYCRTLPEREARKPKPFKYKLVCRSCGMEYLRRRRLDPTRFRCGKCSGKLILNVLD
ncbi:SprT-like protein [Paenibacillus cellulosilyticus]|uniref:SprT-like protein n=1 Tax=Paenibacillus cellulosilyticus TaxID=375489 RepID=A0A2V2YL71_9BACL|nr:SprT family protein [Paenibacillus cellulosilyticus]PWV94227.1 SprT-like protein [Paenibacillus cellulosilyticus]QKS44279.1 SprT family protein [Paenibacillus cellulosilyticus]